MRAGPLARHGLRNARVFDPRIRSARHIQVLIETIAIFGVSLEKVFQYEPKGKR